MGFGVEIWGLEVEVRAGFEVLGLRLRAGFGGLEELQAAGRTRAVEKAREGNIVKGSREGRGRESSWEKGGAGFWFNRGAERTQAREIGKSKEGEWRGGGERRGESGGGTFQKGCRGGGRRRAWRRRRRRRRGGAGGISKPSLLALSPSFPPCLLPSFPIGRVYRASLEPRGSQ